jgi:hypothetical protein
LDGLRVGDCVGRVGIGPLGTDGCCACALSINTQNCLRTGFDYQKSFARRMRRHRSISATYSGAVPATSKPKRHCGLPHASIRHSRTLGTTSATCWTSRDALKPPLNAYAQRCGSRLITPMPRSTSRCYYNEQTNIPRLQITGVAISPVIVNPNGLHGRADH